MADPTRKHTLALLQTWERGSAYAANLLDSVVKSGGLDPKLRPAVQQLLYAVIRNQRLLDYLVNELAEGKVDQKRDVFYAWAWRRGFCSIPLLTHW